VLIIKVRDARSPGARKVLGVWNITLKWLLIEGSHYPFCRHDPRRLDKAVAKDGVLEGWFPLVDTRGIQEGKLGEIQLRLAWSHDPEAKPPNERPLTAMEQMKVNSAESKVRLGSFAEVKCMLESFPVLLNCRRLTFRDVNFYLKDLFMGMQGDAEVKEGDLQKLKSIQLDLLDISKQLRPLPGTDGLSVWGVCWQFWVHGIAPEVRKNFGKLSVSAIGQITSGFFSQLVPTIKQKILRSKEVAVQQHKVRQRAFHFLGHHQRSRAARTLTAYDTDYFLASSLRGYLEKKHAGKTTRWHLCHVELKGATIFYTHVKRSTLAHVGNTRKIDLRCATDALELVAGANGAATAIHIQLPSGLGGVHVLRLAPVGVVATAYTRARTNVAAAAAAAAAKAGGAEGPTPTKRRGSVDEMRPLSIKVDVLAVQSKATIEEWFATLLAEEEQQKSAGTDRMLEVSDLAIVGLRSTKSKSPRKIQITLPWKHHKHHVQLWCTDTEGHETVPPVKVKLYGHDSKKVSVEPTAIGPWTDDTVALRVDVHKQGKTTEIVGWVVVDLTAITSGVAAKSHHLLRAPEEMDGNPDGGHVQPPGKISFVLRKIEPTESRSSGGSSPGSGEGSTDEGSSSDDSGANVHDGDGGNGGNGGRRHHRPVALAPLTADEHDLSVDMPTPTVGPSSSHRSPSERTIPFATAERHLSSLCGEDLVAAAVVTVDGYGAVAVGVEAKAEIEVKVGADGAGATDGGSGVGGGGGSGVSGDGGSGVGGGGGSGVGGDGGSLDGSGRVAGATADLSSPASNQAVLSSPSVNPRTTML
jgi:hypothetical protein